MQNVLTLNIGLNIGKTSEQIDPRAVLYALDKLGFFLRTMRVAQSETEPTMIVQSTVWPYPLRDTVGELCKELQQEAIAVLFPDGSGELYGPKAAEWGPFNHEYFLSI